MNAEDFKAWRQRLHWTQSQAAVALGADRRTISRRESGEIKIARETELACAALEWVRVGGIGVLDAVRRTTAAGTPRHEAAAPSAGDQYIRFLGVKHVAPHSRS